MKIEDSFISYAKFLENLTVKDIPKLNQFVTEDILFIDPFHQVRGFKNMSHIFTNLFEKVANITFKVGSHATNGTIVYFEWTLTGVLSKEPWIVEGVTKLTFNEKNLITEHTEYWDTASQLYEKLPIIGGLMRYFRRRISYLKAY